MIKAPCKNCSFRHETCHSHCLKYLKWKKEQAEIKKKRREDKENESSAIQLFLNRTANRRR